MLFHLFHNMKRNWVRLVTISQGNEMTRYGVLRVQKKLFIILVFVLALLGACEEPAPVVGSTLITNAIIHNGSGSEAFHGAVRIDGDRIIEIGEFDALPGETVINAGGLILAPKFIDVHIGQGEDFRLLPMAEAVYKMTALPAASLGIENRGRIRTGYFADLVLFDPNTVEDEISLQDSTSLPIRIEKIWVNGVLTFDNTH